MLPHRNVLIVGKEICCFLLQEVLKIDFGYGAFRAMNVCGFMCIGL